jgi:tetratricopeptide (TPR) repeat protein
LLVRDWFLATGFVLATACAAAPQAGPELRSPVSQGTAPAQQEIPADPRAAYHFMLGYQAELAQETERAIQEYQASLRLDPDSNYLKARLALLLYSAGDLTSALRYADELQVSLVPDPHAYAQVARIYAGAGQVEKAIGLYDRVIQLAPDRSETYFSKAVLLMNLKRFAEAEPVLSQGLKLAPENAVGHYYQGRLFVETKRQAEAIGSFERAIGLNPSFEPPYLALAGIYEAGQQRDKAIDVYKKYLQGANPKNRDIRQQLIRLYLAEKDYTSALVELHHALQDDPADLDARLRMGLVYGEQKDFPKAIDALNQILAVRPGELKIRDYLGYLYEETKEFEKALDAYRTNIRLEPTYFESYLHLGVLHYRLKHFDDAIASLTQATKLTPTQPEAYIVMGLAYLQSERFDLASLSFEEGIRYNPNNADLHFNLATVYDKLNRFDDVVRALQTALRLDPHHAEALNYLGYTYADRGINVEEALALTQQAVALKPNNGYYVDSLGWAFYKLGRLDEALLQIRRAAALVGDDPVIYEHLGEILDGKNMFQEAREAWLHSLELDPANTKLMDRFIERGMGDPNQEERVRQALRRISEQKAAQRVTP